MRYRPARLPGATYFLTVTLEDRRSTLLVDRIDALRDAVRIVRARHPFEIVAWVTWPDHLHAIWTLPPGYADFSTRWSLIKGRFSRAIPMGEPLAASRVRSGERGIWQRRFWEHVLRDERDVRNHVDYIHFNPVEHGLVERASGWAHSSIHRAIRRGDAREDWGSDGASAPVDVAGDE